MWVFGAAIVLVHLAACHVHIIIQTACMSSAEGVISSTVEVLAKTRCLQPLQNGRRLYASVVHLHNVPV
jgi:hypothetical protein